MKKRRRNGTMAGRGCFAATKEDSFRVYAPAVEVVDGCAAGATFSSGYLYGLLRGWNLEERLRFAIAAASLQCTTIGPTAAGRIERFFSTPLR